MSEDLLNANAAVDSYLSNSMIIVPTDAPATITPATSSDPTMWGALFFVWVILYIPRLAKALIKGANKYEPSAYEGWWIAGIGFLFWGYHEQIAVGDVAGWLFVLSIIFWPFWFNKHKITNISQKSRICLSAVIMWTLAAFTWVFGGYIWDTVANEEISAFLLIVLLPPLVIVFLWRLYAWVNSAPKP